MTVEQTFANSVLAWFDDHGRKDLPWQHNKTRYSVWVSEIMLQQTQVKTVIPYFLRFMQEFPDVVSLANAEQDKVLHLWTGLGYYARARNLHKAAQHVRDKYGGMFPDDFEQVVALPGIGRSTAAAILSLADNQPYVIMDGNVKRVLSRYFAIEGWPGKQAIEQRLWGEAEKLKPDARFNDYTQAMMDLGATLCTRSRPRCEQCPVAKDCIANLSGLQSEFPHKKPKKSLPVKSTTLLILFYAGSVYLEKRASSGIWGGLFGFPEINIDDIDTKLLQMGSSANSIQYLDEFRHTFSHFHLDIQPAFVELEKLPNVIAENNSENGSIWYSLHSKAAVGFAAPTVKIIEQVKKQF